MAKTVLKDQTAKKSHSHYRANKPTTQNKKLSYRAMGVATDDVVDMARLETTLFARLTSAPPPPMRSIGKDFTDTTDITSEGLKRWTTKTYVKHSN